MRTSNVFRGAIVAACLAVAGPACPENTLGYDPAADPFALVEQARGEAAVSGKRVLVIAGGEWCIWCHYLDAFLTDNSDLKTALGDTFVVAKIYIGDEQDNAAFFATLPEAQGYPHFWVLGADGAVLASENTLPLEDGDKSYDRARFAAFIDGWRTAR